MSKYPLLITEGPKYRVIAIKDPPTKSSRNYKDILKCGLCNRDFVKQSPAQKQGNSVCGSCIIEMKCSVCGEYKTFKKEPLKRKRAVDEGSIVLCSNACSKRHLNRPINCPTHGHFKISLGGKCPLCVNIDMTKRGVHPSQNMSKDALIRRNRKSYETKIKNGINPLDNLKRPGVFERSLRTRLKNGTCGFQNKEVHQKTVDAKRDASGKYVGYVPTPAHSKKLCKNCGRETFHFNGIKCIPCFNVEKALGGMSIEEFYRSELELIRSESIDRQIKKKDIEGLIGVPGVWSKDLPDGTVLDVAETQDIGREVMFSIRALRRARKAPYDETKDHIYIYKKYREMAKHSDIIFKLIVTGVHDRTERQMIEMQYAHDRKAKFWRAAPGQTIRKLGVVND